MTNDESAMKRRKPKFKTGWSNTLRLGFWISCLLGTWALNLAGSAATLRVNIAPRFAGEPLAFDAITNLTAASQQISVTRLDFLISNFALRRTDGTWTSLTNWAEFIGGREGRTSFELNNLPAANYDRVKFHVGLLPETNHRPPALVPANHALNPSVNGLHWGWQGGYVFLAIEGNWRSANGAVSGYSYHIANDEQLMVIEMPLVLALTDSLEATLFVDVSKIFSANHQIKIDAATTSTHSRSNDELAAQLRKNIESAFSVAEVRSVSSVPVHPVATRIELAADATPYRFTMSAFFPRPELPLDNPLTEEGVELGRRLFSDPLLSINNSQSCASCHDARVGFAESKRVSISAEGKPGMRNAMPLFNLAWKSSFFWDGRAVTLREQVLRPIQNPIEMHESLSNVVAKLREQGGAGSQSAVMATSGSRRGEDTTPYHLLFARAFGSTEITSDRIARALEQFLLVQVSHDAKFDRVLGGEATFTSEEQRGFELFHTEYDPRRGQFGADCFHCHGGPLFQSAAFANNGLDAKFSDLGRYNATRKNGDKGKFAVPSMRNVELTAPYMHDGRLATLEEVIEHYSTGVKRSDTLDPNLAKHPDGGVRLNEADKRALVAFLKTLTDGRFKAEPTFAQAKSETIR
jgi:cytochrome c peroxidase